MNKKSIITIQSQVASGYVGNNITALAIQLHGLDPIQVPTVLLSNHVDLPQVYGMSMPYDLMVDLFTGITDNLFIQDCDYLITGFCDQKEIIDAVADFISENKNDYGYNYIYDPAFGDFRTGGLYFSKKVANYSVSELLPLSDIMTPNHFELEYILGKTISTEKEYKESLSNHKVLQSKTVITTSIAFEDTLADTVEVALFIEGMVKRYRSTKVPMQLVGSGDLFTAVLTCQLNLGVVLDQAIIAAMDYVRLVIDYAYQKGYSAYNAEAMTRNANYLF